ncbi:hypothetical protein Tco_0546444 [Tanacetum coccineum]
MRILCEEVYWYPEFFSSVGIACGRKAVYRDALAMELAMTASFPESAFSFCLGVADVIGKSHILFKQFFKVLNKGIQKYDFEREHPSRTFRQCSAMDLGTHVISVGFQTNMSRLFLRRLQSSIFTVSDNFPPMVMVCSRYSGWIATCIPFSVAGSL